MPTSNSHLTRAARFEHAAAYVSGPTRANAAAELGLAEAAVVKLSSNENPLGPSPAAAEAIHDLASLLHEYPAPDPIELREALARRFGVAPGSVVTSAGSSTLMHAIAAAFGTPGGQLVRSVPGFEVYAEIARTQMLEVVDVPLRPDDFAFDLPAMLDRLGASTQLIFVTRPNNPTSTLPALDELRVVCEAAASLGAVVVSDEAYLEFAEPSDPQHGSGVALLTEGHDNLVVTRTLSKAFGLGGMRLGYSISKPEVADILRAASPKWPTSSLAQAAALAALADESHLERTLRTVEEQRARLVETLPDLGLSVVPDPQGNFVMVDVRGCALDAAELASALARAAGVLVRGDFSRSHVRISVGTASQNDQLLTGLDAVLRPSVGQRENPV